LVMFNECEDILTVYLKGEIDHHAVTALRNQIDSMILRTESRLLILDFSKVSFMDSSGIGMIIGRYKTMLEKNGSICATGLSPTIERLFRMAGLHRIISIMPKEE